MAENNLKCDHSKIAIGVLTKKGWIGWCGECGKELKDLKTEDKKEKK